MDKNKDFKITFRKNPVFINMMNFSEGNDKKSGELPKILKSLKIGGFKIGNFVTSFWFGVLLFGMQSYFLRQNLKVTDVKYISD